MKTTATVRYSFLLKMFFLISFFSFGEAFGQAVKDLVWIASWSKQNVNVGDEVEIILKAQIEPGYYIYSNDFDPNLGPQHTELELEKHTSYELTGKLTAIGAKDKYDEIWEGNVSVFTKAAEFRIKVKILTKNPVVKGVLTYQLCNDKTCIQFTPIITLPPIAVNSSGLKWVPKNQKGGLTTPTLLQTNTIKPTLHPLYFSLYFLPSGLGFCSTTFE